MLVFFFLKTKESHSYKDWSFTLFMFCKKSQRKVKQSKVFKKNNKEMRTKCIRTGCIKTFQIYGENETERNRKYPQNQLHSGIVINVYYTSKLVNV